MLKVTEVIDQIDMLNYESDVLFNMEKQNFINLFYESFDDNEENYIKFLSQYEIDEYSIMIDFVDCIEDKYIKDALYNTLKGKKVYRKFKDKCYNLNILDNWYTFRDKKHYEISKDWLNKNKIKYIDDFKE